MPLPDHNLFYASRVENGFVYLDNEESRHALAVFRLSTGDMLTATDGKGAIFECRMQARQQSGLSCEIVSTKQNPEPHRNVRMFIGMCDRERFEDVAENCAALGVERIVPTLCRFVQKPWWSSWEKHAVRINKKIIAGIKQAHNPWLPKLDAPISFPEALSTARGSFIITAEAGGVPFLHVVDTTRQSGVVSCFVGPPGGFSQEELDLLKTAEATFVSISSNRLRTELAAAVLCAAVKMAHGS